MYALSKKIKWKKQNQTLPPTKAGVVCLSCREWRTLAWAAREALCPGGRLRECSWALKPAFKSFTWSISILALLLMEQFLQVISHRSTLKHIFTALPWLFAVIEKGKTHQLKFRGYPSTPLQPSVPISSCPSPTHLSCHEVVTERPFLLSSIKPGNTGMELTAQVTLVSTRVSLLGFLVLLSSLHCLWDLGQLNL